MKSVPLVSIILMLFIYMSFYACTSTSKVLAEREKIDSNVFNKNLKIRVRSVNAFRGSQINLTSLYDFVLKNDSLITYLPYFGYSTLPFTGQTENSAIQIKQPVSNWLIIYNGKSKKYLISFNVKDKMLAYNFSLSVFFNGEVEISVNSINRDSIIYYGEIIDP